MEAWLAGQYSGRRVLVIACATSQWRPASCNARRWTPTRWTACRMSPSMPALPASGEATCRCVAGSSARVSLNDANGNSYPLRRLVAVTLSTWIGLAVTAGVWRAMLAVLLIPLIISLLLPTLQRFF